MNYQNDLFIRNPKPIEKPQYVKEREETVVYKSDNNNLWGELMRDDYSTVNFDADNRFKFNAPQNKKDVKPYVGSLPHKTTPKTYELPQLQMIPETTRVSKVCMNDAINNAGPWYLRQWPRFQDFPFKPSLGDISRDPRYGLITRNESVEYKRL